MFTFSISTFIVLLTVIGGCISARALFWLRCRVFALVFLCGPFRSDNSQTIPLSLSVFHVTISAASYLPPVSSIRCGQWRMASVYSGIFGPSVRYSRVFFAFRGAGVSILQARRKLKWRIFMLSTLVTVRIAQRRSHEMLEVFGETPLIVFGGGVRCSRGYRAG